MSAGDLPPFEQERFELLQDIAGMMRRWTKERPEINAEDLDASLGLLCHLARSNDVVRVMRQFPQFKNARFRPAVTTCPGMLIAPLTSARRGVFASE